MCGHMLQDNLKELGVLAYTRIGFALVSMYVRSSYRSTLVHTGTASQVITVITEEVATMYFLTILYGTGKTVIDQIDAVNLLARSILQESYRSIQLTRLK